MYLVRLINNEEKYFEFIRGLRNHEDNISGFIIKKEITSEEQIKYMEKYKTDYFICVDDKDTPLGWIGVVDNDIRLCTDPTYKRLGVGTFMLNTLHKPNATAKVLIDNEASNNLFIKCGFEQYNEDEYFKYYKK